MNLNGRSMIRCIIYEVVVRTSSQPEFIGIARTYYLVENKFSQTIKMMKEVSEDMKWCVKAEGNKCETFLYKQLLITKICL